MALRSIASVRLSFGLVTVPVNIYPAGESSAKIAFNWLHKKCSNRLKQQSFCPEDNEVVEKDDKIKGYEFQKGEYVLFTPEELKVLEAKGTQTIEIAEFIPEESVDRVYLSKVYYLGPDKGGDKAYQLLSAALSKTKKIAVARYAARGKQYLVAIRAKGKGLVMEQLYYAHELRDFKDVPLGEASINKKELDLAVQVIKSAEGKEFKPKAYKDDVRNRMLETIQKKIDGQDITKIEEAPQRKVIDLMDALKASIGPAKKTKTRMSRASRVVKKAGKK